MLAIANRKFRMMFRRFAIVICLPLGLAACGVAVEQASQPQTSAPRPSVQSAASSPAPASQTDSARTAAPQPRAAAPVIPESETTETALLAPSVTGSIDGLIDSIADAGETDTPAAAEDGDDERPEIGVDDGIELPVAEAPASALPESPEAVAPQGDVTEETVPAGSDAEDQTEAQQDTAEIVGNIIWNIESAQKAVSKRRTIRLFRSGRIHRLPVKRLRRPLPCWRGVNRVFPLRAS